LPNIIAHCWYGEVMSTNLYSDSLRSVIRKHRNVFMLGTQASDFFAAYHRMPWQSKKNAKLVQGCLGKMHNDRVNESFRYIFEFARRQKDDVITAYVAGYICHWALDMSVHPYVFYSTGNSQESAGLSHQLFETYIDYRVIKDNELDTEDYASYRLIANKEHADGKIAELYFGVLHDVYGLNVTKKEITDSINDFRKVHKLLWDPQGKRYGFVERLENAFGLQGFGTTMMLPREYDSEMDAINDRKAEWHNVADYEITSNETFYEMAKKAIGEGITLLTLFDRYMKGDIEVEALLEDINDRSFFTGLDYRKPLKFYRQDIER